MLGQGALFTGTYALHRHQGGQGKDASLGSHRGLFDVQKKCRRRPKPDDPRLKTSIRPPFGHTRPFPVPRNCNLSPCVRPCLMASSSPCFSHRIPFSPSFLCLALLDGDPISHGPSCRRTRPCVNALPPIMRPTLTLSRLVCVKRPSSRLRPSFGMNYSCVARSGTSTTRTKRVFASPLRMLTWNVWPMKNQIFRPFECPP